MKNKILIYFPDTGGYNFTPPYEVLFQLRALTDYNINIKVLDSAKNKDEILIRQLLENTAVVIISTIIKYTSITITFQVKDGINFSKRVAELSIPVIWTGMAACLLEKNIIEFCKNDLVLKSNHESLLGNIMNEYFNSGKNKELSSIFKEYDTFHLPKTNSFEEFGDFSFEAINIEDYIHNYTFDYIATTGCINSCSFCSVPSIYHQKWTHNKIENIVNHLKYILSNYSSIKVIHFRDDNFPINKNFVFDLFDSINKENIKFLWSCQTSVNILLTYNDEDLLRLYNSGCRNISLGVESGDEFILKKVTKSKTSKESAIKVIKKLLKNNISVSVTSIISFHYNNGRDYNKTLKFLMKLKLIYPQLSMYCTVFQPIPGTEIFNEIYFNKKYSLDLLDNNTWTSKKRKSKLKKFESFYFVFDNNNFYKTLPDELSIKLKLINKLFSPLIKLRFCLGITFFLWEYFLISPKIKKIKNKFGIKTDSVLSDVGIRHLTSNFNYGFKQT